MWILVFSAYFNHVCLAPNYEEDILLKYPLFDVSFYYVFPKFRTMMVLEANQTLYMGMNVVIAVILIQRTKAKTYQLEACTDIVIKDIFSTTRYNLRSNKLFLNERGQQKQPRKV